MRSLTLGVLLAAAVSTSAQQPQKDSAVIGVVIDAATGAPIAGAIVTLRPSNPDLRVPLDSVTERAITTNDGEFVFGPIGAASYNLSASGAGYLGSGNGRQRPDGPTQPVIVGEREVVDGLTIKMWRTAVIGGTVTDEFGEPVVGCLVNVVRRTWAAGRPRFEAVGTPATDDRGVYRIANLTPGEYAAFVPGMRVSYPAGFAPTAQSGQALLEIQRYSTILLPTNDSGFPKVPQNMTPIGAPGSPINERVGNFLTQTPQQSRSIAPAAAKTGAIRVYPTTFAPAGSSPASARVVSVAAGETSANLDISLRLVPAVNITGTIETPSGPGAFVVVRLEPADNGNEVSETGFDAAIGVADAKGAFALVGVPAGQYVIRASYGGSSIGRSVPGSAASITQPIAVEDRDVNDLALVMKPGIQITGRVEFEGDLTRTPATQSLTLMLRQDTGSWFIHPQTRVGADRQFSIASDPGVYTVSVIGSGSQWFLKSAVTGGRDIATAPTAITGDVSDLVVTLTDSPAAIAGTVRTSNGAADPLAVVLIFPADRSLWGNASPGSRTFADARVDRTGAYTASGLAAGDYFVIAVADADLTQPRSRLFLEAAARLADRVTVRDGETARHDVKTQVVR